MQTPKLGIERDPVRHGFTILSVTIWIAHSMTDRIIKSGIELYDPVRHGMSYPDSDGQDHKTMTDSL